MGAFATDISLVALDDLMKHNISVNAWNGFTILTSCPLNGSSIEEVAIRG